MRDIEDGIIETPDGRYVSLFEVLPVPFFLKRPGDQEGISESFAAFLKSAPDLLHLKSVSVKSDLAAQVSAVRECMENEKSPECAMMAGEYAGALELAAETGITRRFFISFRYSGKAPGTGGRGQGGITAEMRTETERLAESLSRCGNVSILPDPDDPQGLALETMYMLFHRGSYSSGAFKRHREKIYGEYLETYGRDGFFVPPKDYVAPSAMSFLHHRYVVTDGVCQGYLYIPSYGYNPDVVTGWPDVFITSFPDVDVDIFLERVSGERIMPAIRRNISRAKVSMSETTDATDSFDSASGKLSSGYYLKGGLSSGQDFYNMAVIITVGGKTPEEVEAKKSELKKAGRRMDVTLHDIVFECEDAFQAVLPTGMYDGAFMKKMRRNVLTDGAASLYPFTTFRISDPGGLYIGDDPNGSPCIPDFFDGKRLSNPHVFICGQTGAGKTITLMLIALRARVMHMPVFILAPEKQDEFRRLCTAVGGTFASIGAGSPDRINIMEIFKPDDAAVETKRLLDGETGFSLLEEKVAVLTEFLGLYIRDMTAAERQLLSEAVTKTYGRYGITSDNSSLYAGDGSGGYRKMPVLTDLVNTLSEDEGTKRLAVITGYFMSGPGRCFNGETNIKTDTGFTVIGLEHNTKDMLGLSVYLAMDYAWSRIREDRTRKKFLFIDEWWKLAFDPVAAERSLEISKTARAYSCSMVIATQQMGDILAVENGKYGNAVLNNCASRILMSMKEKDAAAVREMAGLTESEYRGILRADPGCGLLISGADRTGIRFTPTETEKLLCFTDSATLLRYAGIRRGMAEGAAPGEDGGGPGGNDGMMETFDSACGEI